MSVVAPPAAVVSLSEKQPPLPTFADLDRQNDAAQAASDVLDGDEVDLEALKSRAYAFNGALSTLDLVDVTGAEFWAVFKREPARSVYLAWARNALSKLQDIVALADKQEAQRDC